MLLMAWSGLTIGSVMGRYWILGAVLGPFAAGIALAIIRLLVTVVLAPLVSRVWPPVAVRPPAESVLITGPLITYILRPRLLNPMLTAIRRQGGWVLLTVKIDRRGRIEDCLVEDQAPGHIFDAAARAALFGVRAPGRPGAKTQREARYFITFAPTGRPTWTVQKADEEAVPA